MSWLFVLSLGLTALLAMGLLYGYGKKTVALPMLGIPVLAAVLYGYWGDFRGQLQYYALAQQVQAEIKKIKTPEQLITRLQARLARDPDSLEGWLLLGRLEFKRQHFKEAASAYGRAYTLRANDPDIIIQYATALFFADGKRLRPASLALVQKCLQLETDQAAALNLLAMDAYQQQHYRAAIEYWQRMLPQYGSANSDRQYILEGIQQAKSKLQQ